MMGGMGFGWFIWVILLGVIIWGILQFTNRNSQINDNESESPMDILKKRYASGEISKEKFEEIKEKIK